MRSGSPLDIRITRPDTVFVCNQAAGCTLGGNQVANGFVVNALPTSGTTSGFIATINTPGGNNSRNTRRPDLIPGVNPFLDLANGLRLLNPAAFAMPAPGTYGNLPRNFLKGPSFHQFDLTLQKRFAINDRMNIEFRSKFTICSIVQTFQIRRRHCRIFSERRPVRRNPDKHIPKV